MHEGEPTQRPQKSKIEIAKEKFGSLANEETIYGDILESRREQILAHEYSCVIGDDKSAREPGFVIGNAINTIYEENSQSRIPVLFINPHNLRASFVRNSDSPPHSDIKREKFDQLKAKALVLLKKANVQRGTMLLVTDFIGSGETVKIFKQIAEEHGLKTDVANYWDWHWQPGDFMVDSKNEDSIHSEPLWMNVETEEDFKKQIERLVERKIVGGKVAFWMLAHASRQGIILNAPEFHMDEEEKAREYLLTLAFSDKLNILSFFRSAGPNESRNKALAFSKHLAETFRS